MGIAYERTDPGVLEQHIANQIYLWNRNFLPLRNQD